MLMNPNLQTTAEHQRLADSEARRADWKHWGPYVSERAWGTVREDYSPKGEVWESFPHDHARSRAYRWNEDGLGGFCNRFQNLCLSVALWNEQDPILKERLFGLTGNEGNHGEDVKEVYFYLDSTPTHSYAKLLYRYPQVAFPYERLVEGNRARSRFDPEFELIDAIPEVFAEHRYFDVFIEYAKHDEEDILCRITAWNRGPDPAPLVMLPHLFFRNTWSWGYDRPRPLLKGFGESGVAGVHAQEPHLGDRWWVVSAAGSEEPEVLFTENDTNKERLFGIPNDTPFVKDGINEAVLLGRRDRVNPDRTGTKAAAVVRRIIAPGSSASVWVRLSPTRAETPFADFEEVFARRIEEADAFYDAVLAPGLTQEERSISRQAFAGLLWSKQFYHLSVDLWLKGDPAGPPPPRERRHGRNRDWTHLYNLDVVSMPDKWEYPWYAAWDLAFHMIPMARIDPEWAKRQMLLMLREWYMHPNGQLPAYEWDFGDVNPPVHAWGVWRVYKITRNVTGEADTEFLERAFHKLLLNFTWWVNRKDADGRNVFQGGFLGLDNIGVFDRSKPLPHGAILDQADGTAWMGMFCLNMLSIALELARTRPAYEDVATKFFEHFVSIAQAINAPDGHGLWDEEDGFYYDALYVPGRERVPIKLKSFVGLIPLFAVETIGSDVLDRLPNFRRRMDWFMRYRPGLMDHLTLFVSQGNAERCLLSLVGEERLKRLLTRLLDAGQFLSDFGLRSLSREHAASPLTFHLDGQAHTVAYEPAESSSGLFGGNSNWRGPIWFPINYLMIESLQKFHHFFGDRCTVEMPSGSGHRASLDDIASELSRRLIRLFLRDRETGRRPFHGDVGLLQDDPHGRDHILFHEYFHGDTGAGLGASHQTGWTALVATLLQKMSARRI